MFIKSPNLEILNKPLDSAKFSESNGAKIISIGEELKVPEANGQKQTWLGEQIPSWGNNNLGGGTINFDGGTSIILPVAFEFTTLHMVEVIPSRRNPSKIWLQIQTQNFSLYHYVWKEASLRKSGQISPD
jgi:hypothetical protein